MTQTQTKTASRIRREFVDFFVRREHREVPSAPVFPQDDPTLLFTNAGMNQFKDVFLGTGRRDYTRAVDTQKCIRVSGKHNDLEEVGVDTYHHTFFEMLGNWSFGDYFKAEAIAWAWELLTEVWGLPRERLWVTVFSGDEGDGLPADEDAERVWRETPGVDPAHVLRFDRADNFWEMGDTGPCGPCSEIHFDRGGPDTDPRDGADRKRGVNAGNERFIELWNLVFIEFNRLEDGKLVPLPARHVDTGMGFERLVAVLQGKRSNYDTDVFAPIFATIRDVVGADYRGGDAQTDVAFRVIADHVRAVASAFADGALPSNVGRGYVLRRLIRRASRWGRQAFGCEEPFLHRVVPAVCETLGEVFPEIPARLEHVQTLLRAEEEAFGKTLGRGLVRFGELAERVAARGEKRLPGEKAYDLYATYGFPADLVELMARERGLEVDRAGWERAHAAHQDASRAEGRFKSHVPAEELAGLAATESTYHADGERSVLVEDAVVTACFERPVTADAAPGGEAPGGEADRTPVTVVLSKSPFYPEGGGQIGDAGTIEAPDGSWRIAVDDTQKAGEVVLHAGRVVHGAPPAPGVPVIARVDRERRRLTRKNHTATHLLQRALREVLGDHVHQHGSYVGPDRLRFDFSHPKALTPDEIERVEALVNERVIANPSLKTTIEDLEAAKARGVVALFGEKYDERVRVVDVDGWSTELCGGTHVRATGDIGPFLIVAEGAIQAGVRRIEALTGPAALEVVQRQKRQLQELSRTLKVAPDELAARVGELQKQVKAARKKAEKTSAADVAAAFRELPGALAEVEGVLAGAVGLELDQKALRELATRVKTLAADLAVLLVGRSGENGEKVPWIALCQGAALERGLDARNAGAFLRSHLGGGGGGRPELTQGQGQGAAGREAVLGELADDPLAAFRSPSAG